MDILSINRFALAAVACVALSSVASAQRFATANCPGGKCPLPSAQAVQGGTFQASPETFAVAGNEPGGYNSRAERRAERRQQGGPVRNVLGAFFGVFRRGQRGGCSSGSCGG